jgi:hypothetical protein
MNDSMSNNPVAINAYRDNTERQKSMAGVTVPSFLCKKCKKNKPAMGRKQAVKGTTKYGFLCAECAAA